MIFKKKKSDIKAKGREKVVGGMLDFEFRGLGENDSKYEESQIIRRY